MTIQDFITKLEGLGFKDYKSYASMPKHEYLRSYDPPESFRCVMISLNLGGRDEEMRQGIYAVTFQSPDYEEMGGPFPMRKPDEELLSALASGPENFLKWFNSHVIATF